MFSLILNKRAVVAAFAAVTVVSQSGAQLGHGSRPPVATQNQTSRNDADSDSERAEGELRAGTALTSKGSFAEAIPHLLAARGHVINEYAASFNLALCFVGTGQFQKAIEILESLRKNGHASADVENLLAQSFVGNGQAQQAFDALQRAALLTPANEKLYLYVADACTDQHEYALGLKVVELGLENLPNSAWLHYERAMFRSLLDDFDRARRDFASVQQLAPGSEVSYLAAGHEALYSGNPQEAVRAAREGVRKGHPSATLLTLLGEGLMRSGARPGEPEFAEAQSALEKAVAAQPRYADAQLSLGRLYLALKRIEDAITHLEEARELAPGNPSVYATLAKACQQHGDQQRAQDALATLSKLNQAQADKIASSPADRKQTYAVSSPE